MPEAQHAPPAWLRLWAGGMPAAAPLTLAAAAAVAPLPDLELPIPIRPLAVLLAAAAGLWAGLGYARAVRRGRRSAMWATFLGAGFFTWTGVAQIGPALPAPGPLVAALWLTAWVAAFVALAWRF